MEEHVVGMAFDTSSHDPSCHACLARPENYPENVTGDYHTSKGWLVQEVMQQPGVSVYRTHALEYKRKRRRPAWKTVPRFEHIPQ